jgi:hypothetical protein
MLQWFDALWACARSEGYEGAEKFAVDSLCVPSIMMSVHGLDSMFHARGQDQSAEDSAAPSEPLPSDAQMKEWVKKNLSAERLVVAGKDSIVVGSTGEFDVEYAFFNLPALRNKELGENLMPLWVERNGTVAARAPKQRASACLKYLKNMQ